MKVLVLYSWEENQEEAKQWATSMCYELSKYENIDARCDMFWKPKSDVKKAVYENIKKADKIIVIVTDNYNYKVSNLIGMVSYEEKIYSEIISNDGSYSMVLFSACFDLFWCNHHNTYLMPIKRSLWELQNVSMNTISEIY